MFLTLDLTADFIVVNKFPLAPNFSNFDFECERIFFVAKTIENKMELICE